MKVEMEVWEAFQWDGGDRQNSVGLFTNKEDAKVVAGQHGRVASKVLMVFSSVEEYEYNTRAELRKRAIAKLTPAERAALGVLE